jgi:hypothetical protein
MTLHKIKRLLTISVLPVLFAFGAASCSSDSKSAADVADSVVVTVKDAVAEASDALTDSSVPQTVAGSGAEGAAKGYAMEMKTALEAMPGGGEPTVANLNAAMAPLAGKAEVSGLDDSDSNGKDDDAKVTVVVGDDKACLQSQNAIWEVTDDEC